MPAVAVEELDVYNSKVAEVAVPGDVRLKNSHVALAAVAERPIAYYLAEADSRPSAAVADFPNADAERAS